MTDSAQPVQISDDVYVLTVDAPLTKEQVDTLSKSLANVPGKMIVLTPGMTLQRVPSIEVVERIEQKLDLLIAMMLDDEEQPDHTALEDEAMDNQEPESL